MANNNQLECCTQTQITIQLKSLCLFPPVIEKIIIPYYSDFADECIMNFDNLSLSIICNYLDAVDRLQLLSEMIYNRRKDLCILIIQMVKMLKFSLHNILEYNSDYVDYTNITRIVFTHWPIKYKLQWIAEFYDTPEPFVRVLRNVDAFSTLKAKNSVIFQASNQKLGLAIFYGMNTNAIHMWIKKFYSYCDVKLLYKALAVLKIDPLLLGQHCTTKLLLGALKCSESVQLLTLRWIENCFNGELKYIKDKNHSMRQSIIGCIRICDLHIW